MSNTHKHVIKNQEDFFNKNAHHAKDIDLDSFFSKYANKEQQEGFSWISDKKNILEYGCGTGTSLDVFFKKRNKKKYHIYGVDIARRAVEEAKKNYPEYTFFKIINNKMPQIKDSSLDAAFMFHVLHHTDEHAAIFNEINKKLKKNGKFLINDLSSNNPINKLGRMMFVHMPKFVKNKFSDDLVVGESIPEKYKVNIDDVVQQLRNAGFTNIKVGHGHLFFFIFGWIDRFTSFSRIPFVTSMYTECISFERYLLKFPFFQRYTEVFSVSCYKK